MRVGDRLPPVALEHVPSPGTPASPEGAVPTGVGVITYNVEHDTRYVYDTPVSTSQHLACLRPRELPYQHVRSFDLFVDPQPAHIAERVDYFGNVAHQFQLLRRHIELRVTTRSIVDIRPRDSLMLEDSPAWEVVRDALLRPSGELARNAAEFVYTSPQAGRSPDLARFARVSFAPGRPLLAAALDLMHRIHTEFVFDTTATTVATPVTRVLVDRRGVCQDFAHFQVACLRSLGLAARYVSGYLLTDPPPGQPRLIGADASHAWLSVFCPRLGWVDLDPTNDVIVEQRHVTIGWGRDYSDVSPLRGVLLGGAGHRLLVGVSVVPRVEF
jgi:transglutaminase-like putative cysteine protease